MFTLLLLGVVVGLSLNCTVDEEPIDSVVQLQGISFEITDGLDDETVYYKNDGSGNYQTDSVTVTITQGPVDTVEIYTSVDGLPYVSQELEETSPGSQVFTGEIEVIPSPVSWFVGARSDQLFASAQVGTSESPLLAQKYLNKTDADVTIRDRLNSLLSGGTLATLFPAAGDNVHTYSMLLSGGNTVDVELDHFVEFPGGSLEHAQYGVEYVESVDPGGNLIQGVETSTYQELEQNTDQDMGHIMISSANTDRLREILLSPEFFQKNQVGLEPIYY